MSRQGWLMAGAVIALVVVFEGGAYTWRLFDEKEAQRAAWDISSAWTIGLSNVLAAAWVVSRGHLLASMIAVPLIGLAGIWHALEATICRSLNLMSGSYATAAQSACDAVTIPTYSALYPLLLLGYAAYLAGRLWWFTSSDEITPEGNFVLYHKPRGLQQFLAAIVFAPAGARSRVVDGRWFRYAGGRLVEGDPPRDLCRYVVRRKPGPSLADLRERVGERWTITRNCFTRL